MFDPNDLIEHPENEDEDILLELEK